MSRSDGNGLQGRGSRSDSERVALVTRNGAVAVAVITALGGVAAAIVGLIAANGSGVLTTTIGSPTPVVQISYVPTPGPTVTITQSTTSGESTGGNADSAAPPVRNSGSVTLVAGGDPVDLGATESDWHTGNGDTLSYTSDDALRFYYVDRFTVSAGTGLPTYSDCARPGGYDRSDMDSRRLEVGMRICVRTADDIYGSLRLTQVSRQSIAFDLQTWEKE